MGGRAPVRAGNKLARTLQDLARFLSAHEGDAMVIGGIAVIAHGVIRTTQDIDVTISGDAFELPVLLDALERVGFEARIPNALGFAAETHVLLMRHRKTGVPLDVALGWSVIEMEALARATPKKLAGTTVRVARPEDLVIMKTIAWRLQDQIDIEKLLLRYRDEIDLARVRHRVRELQEALGKDRLGPLETLIQRTRNLS